MAPRGRSRKRKNLRMDAAMDAMTKELQFPEEIVKKVMNELLEGLLLISQLLETKWPALSEEYGGDDGWYFIEQYGYQELLNAILRYQDENNKVNHHPANVGNSPEPESGSLQYEKAEELVGPSDVAKESEPLPAPDVDHIPPTDKDGKGWKDIVLDQSSSQRARADAIYDKGEKSDYASSSMLSPPPLIPTTPLGISIPNRPESSPILSPLPIISSPPPVKRVPSKRRQPCYGWIESDEEDAGEFIELMPAMEWETFGFGAHKPSKRRSRWDLRPEDP